MEKRVRLPMTGSELRQEILYITAALALAIFIVHCPWRRSGARAEEMITPALMAFFAICRWLWLRARSFEVSETGFAVCLGPWTYYRADWKTVQHVQTRRRRIFGWFGNAYEETRVQMHDYFSVELPRNHPDKHEILNVLKQHLPESVFVAG